MSDASEIQRHYANEIEQMEFREAVEDIFSRFDSMEVSFLDTLSPADGFQFHICGYCQAVRSAPLAVYRIMPDTPAEVFITIGMSIALEALFEYKIPKLVLVRQESELPSILRGYDVVEAVNTSELRRKLKAIIPNVVRALRETEWQPKPLPFIHEFNISGHPDGVVVIPERQLSRQYIEQYEFVQNLLVQVAEELGGVSIVHLWVYEGPTQDLLLWAHRGLPVEPRHRLKLGEGIVGRAALVRKTLLISDVQLDPHHIAFYEQSRSAIAVPLTSQDQALVGVVCVEATEVDRFQPNDVRRLEVFAVALVRVLLDRQERELAAQTAAQLGEVRHAIASIRDPQRILQQLTESTLSIFRADMVVLYPFDQHRAEYIDVTNVVSAGARTVVSRLERPQSGSGITAMVLQEHLVVVEDVQASLAEISNSPFISREAIRSFIGTAIRDNDDVLGVMYINYRTPHKFTHTERQLVEQMARLAADTIKALLRTDRIPQRVDLPRDLSEGRVANIIERYEGQRIKAASTQELDQFFVYQDKLHYIDLGAAGHCEERGLPVLQLEPEEKFILELSELRGVDYDAGTMLQVLAEIDARKLDNGRPENEVTNAAAVDAIVQEDLVREGLNHILAAPVEAFRVRHGLRKRTLLVGLLWVQANQPTRTALAKAMGVSQSVIRDDIHKLYSVLNVQSPVGLLHRFLAEKLL